MNPQQHLNDLFFADTCRLWKTGGCSATDAVTRLRLYIAATGYGQSLKDAFLSGGFTSREYDCLLACYDKESKKRERF